MEQPRTVPLTQALEYLLDADRVFVRLALSRGDDDRTVLRCLVVEVLPKLWLASHDQELLGPWLRDQQMFECRTALFYCGLRKSDEIRHWFDHPDNCALTGFDARPGYSDRRVGFTLPTLYDQATRWSYHSYEESPLRTIPYPCTLYSMSMQSGQTTNAHNNDDEALVGEDGEDFPSFRAARAELIFGAAGQGQEYQRDDLIAVRVVDARGWLQAVQLKPDRVAVTVAGLDAIKGGYVVVQGEGFRDKQQVFTNHATLKRPPHITDHIEIRLLGNGVVWDKATIANPRHPYLHTSPQVNIEPGSFTEPDTTTRESAIGVALARDYLGYSAGTEIVSPQSVGVHQLASQPPNDPMSPRERSPRVLRVAVVSPGDVQKERNVLDAVVAEINDGIAGHLGLDLKLWRWEKDAYPDFHGEGAQGHIDQLMRVKDADIVLGIFWTRFGSPVADAKSGTEHELRLAYASWKETRSPHIMLYFNEQARKPKDIDLTQLQAVIEFKHEMQGKALVRPYPNSSKFADIVRKDLTALLRQNYGQGA